LGVLLYLSLSSEHLEYVSGAGVELLRMKLLPVRDAILHFGHVRYEDILVMNVDRFRTPSCVTLEKAVFLLRSLTLPR
jgi:hypothetical protein